MSSLIPDRINHRRRVVYRALTEVLRDDPRVPELFALLDGLVVKESQFLASRLVDEGIWMGLLRDEERTPLIRALIRNMSLPYEQLPKYPDDLVARTLEGLVTDKAPPIPSLTQSFPPEPSNSRDSIFANAPTRPEFTPGKDLDPEREAAPELLQYCAHRVFLMMVSRFIRTVQDTRPVSLGRLMIYKALQTNQDALVTKILQPWDRGKMHVRALPANLTIEQMQAILQLLKLTADEILGKEFSQEIMDYALAEAQRMQEAIEFPPQNLLVEPVAGEIARD